MKNHTATRVVAIVTLVCALSTFALPAAAAPWTGFAADGTWSVASAFHWFQTLWGSWFGGHDLGAEPSGSSDGVAKIYDKAYVVAEPDGVRSMSPSDGTYQGDDLTPGFPASL